MNSCAAILFLQIVVLFSSWSVSLTFAGQIIGVASGFSPGTAPVVSINPNTGVYTVTSTSGRFYFGLAQNSIGEIYGAWFSGAGFNNRVSLIDPLTGSPITTFDTVTPGADSIRGISFDLTDRLFAVVNRNNAQGSPTLPDDLYEIDLSAETATLIGSLGFTGVQALDVAPTGEFYAWDVSEGLLTVNPSTGVATDVNPSIGGTAAIQSIVFATDGRLFGGRNQLYQIDPATGSFVALGPGGGPDVRGMEWVVPEPSGLSLLGSLIVLSLAYSRGTPISRDQCDPSS